MLNSQSFLSPTVLLVYHTVSSMPGWRRQLLSAVVRCAHAYQFPLQLNQPVKTDFGYHLCYVCYSHWYPFKRPVIQDRLRVLSWLSLCRIAWNLASKYLYTALGAVRDGLSLWGLVEPIPHTCIHLKAVSWDGLGYCLGYVCLTFSSLLIPIPYLYTLLMAMFVMVIISWLQCMLQIRWKWHGSILRFPFVRTTLGSTTSLTWWNTFSGRFVAHVASTPSYMLSEVWTGRSTMCLIKKTLLPPSSTVSTSSHFLFHLPLSRWHCVVIICTESFPQWLTSITVEPIPLSPMLL